MSMIFDEEKYIDDIKEALEKKSNLQKAIGWSLREYSKLEPELIKEFVEKTDLSSLSEREDLKAVNR